MHVDVVGGDEMRVGDRNGGGKGKGGVQTRSTLPYCYRTKQCLIGQTLPQNSPGWDILNLRINIRVPNNPPALR